MEHGPAVEAHGHAQIGSPDGLVDGKTRVATLSVDVLVGRFWDSAILSAVQAPKGATAAAMREASKINGDHYDTSYKLYMSSE